MREIKFRAWNTDYLKPIMEYFGLKETMGKSYNSLHKFQDKEIMQFTGLTDCEGREIYEGDIVLDSYDDWHVAYEVAYDTANAAFMLHRDGDCYEFDSPANATASLIGNIFENPELIKNKGIKK